MQTRTPFTQNENCWHTALKLGYFHFLFSWPKSQITPYLRKKFWHTSHPTTTLALYIDYTFHYQLAAHPTHPVIEYLSLSAYMHQIEPNVNVSTLSLPHFTSLLTAYKFPFFHTPRMAPTYQKVFFCIFEMMKLVWAPNALF